MKATYKNTLHDVLEGDFLFSQKRLTLVDKTVKNSIKKLNVKKHQRNT